MSSIIDQSLINDYAARERVWREGDNAGHGYAPDLSDLIPIDVQSQWQGDYVDAFRDADGALVLVADSHGPWAVRVERAEIDADDIRALRAEAAQAGDSGMVALCDRAIAGDTAARRDCCDAIEDARAALDA